MASSAALVRQLEKSVLFQDDFPRRQHVSHAEWASLSGEDRAARRSPEGMAIRRVKDARALADVVRQLGIARYEPAVSLLARIWRDCALVPVRNAAGHALRAIATPQARAALEELIDDADHESVFLAVRAVFEADPAAAFEKFAPYFDSARVRAMGGSVVPREILATFCPSSVLATRDGKEQPRWSDVRAPGWLASDRRWLDLCIRLRRDDRLGDIAREALRYADPKLVQPALAEALSREPPRIAAVRSAARGDLVERYRRGEHEIVWRELRAHEAIAGHFRDEALAVARETMARVAGNADRLAERLAAFGWRAVSGSLRRQPASGDEDIMARVEQVTGAPLPPSLRAFWEVVGGIDFIWNYEDENEMPSLGPDLEMDQMDPLALWSPRIATALFDEWDHLREGIHPELADPFNLDLAPDSLHKANISGGPPYGVELPFAGADPVLVNEAHELPLVDYLRLCFRWGGFPGLERYESAPGVRRFVATMTAGLQPF